MDHAREALRVLILYRRHNRQDLPILIHFWGGWVPEPECSSDDDARLTGGFQFGLGHVLLLLTATAVYFGLTRIFFRDSPLPVWFDLSAGTVGFLWTVLLLTRTIARVRAWRRGRRRTTAHRADMERLVRAKRSEIESKKAHSSTTESVSAVHSQDEKQG